jgi:hypothetical protein
MRVASFVGLAKQIWQPPVALAVIQLSFQSLQSYIRHGALVVQRAPNFLVNGIVGE